MEPTLLHRIPDIQEQLGLPHTATGNVFYKKLVETLTAAIYICDPDGYITFYNQAAIELWGRRPEIGKDLWCGSWKIYRPEDGLPMSFDECPMAKALRGRKSIRGEEIVVERPDGSRRNILPHPDPIFDDQGKVIAAVNMLVDITALKEKENEIRESESRLKKLTKELEQRVEERTKQLKDANVSLAAINGELEQFAFIASHDMQEPLRKIKTFATRLEKDSFSVLNDRSKSYLNKIKASTGRMESLIHDVLNYSRIGYLDNQFVETDLNIILDNILDDFEVLIEDRKATIVRGPLPVLHAIPLHINQLFHNLISNSLKFCKETEPCTIEITSRLLPPTEVVRNQDLDHGCSYCEIIVRDNGIGFNQEFAETIFKIFKRLNGRDSHEGSGIGLALCRKIVNFHHGQIFAESRMNIGTSIHIILPAVNDSSFSEKTRF